jgi:P27 family predicted phage terminase small subunit
MAGDGRRQSASIKILKGNASKDPKLGVPSRVKARPITKKPPKVLDKEERKIWKEFVDKADKSDQYLEMDESFLERYCVLKADIYRLTKFIKENGHSVEIIKETQHGTSIEVKERPESRVLTKLVTIVNKMEESLGMTPISRRRLGIEAGDSKDNDLLMTFLNRKKKTS